MCNRFGLILIVVSVYTNSYIFQISLSVVLIYVAHISGTRILLFQSCPVFNRHMIQSTTCHLLIGTNYYHYSFMSTDRNVYRFICRLISNFNYKKNTFERFHLRPEIMFLDFFQHLDLQMNHSCFLISFWG
jgi:hypothetical protein